jgi:hypothetical protein
MDKAVMKEQAKTFIKVHWKTALLVAGVGVGSFVLGRKMEIRKGRDGFICGLVLDKPLHVQDMVALGLYVTDGGMAECKDAKQVLIKYYNKKKVF